MPKKELPTDLSYENEDCPCVDQKKDRRDSRQDWFYYDKYRPTMTKQNANDVEIIYFSKSDGHPWKYPILDIPDVSTKMKRRQQKIKKQRRNKTNSSKMDHIY